MELNFHPFYALRVRYYTRYAKICNLILGYFVFEIGWQQATDLDDWGLEVLVVVVRDED